MAIRTWFARITNPEPDPEGAQPRPGTKPLRKPGGGQKTDYLDEDGRLRSPRGYLRNKSFGEVDFRRSFKRQPGWDEREYRWWDRWDLEDYDVFDCDRYGRIVSLYDHHDPRYYAFAGDEVDDYSGPFVTKNFVKYVSRFGDWVPPWTIMRPASHSDQRMQFPGFGGSPPESWGSTWTWRSGLKLHRSLR
jgi:hypothetical protein